MVGAGAKAHHHHVVRAEQKQDGVLAQVVVAVVDRLRSQGHPLAVLDLSKKLHPLQRQKNCLPSLLSQVMKPLRSPNLMLSRSPREKQQVPRKLPQLGPCPLHLDFVGITHMSVWGQLPAEAGVVESTLPEVGVSEGPMGEGAEVPEVGSSEATGSSEEMMAGVAVGLEDLPIPLLPEAEQPVRQGVRVQNMRRSLSDAGSEAQRQAVRHMRVI